MLNDKWIGEGMVRLLGRDGSVYAQGAVNQGVGTAGILPRIFQRGPPQSKGLGTETKEPGPGVFPGYFSPNSDFFLTLSKNNPLMHYDPQRVIAPLAKLLDWLAIQLVWGRRVKSLLKLQSPAADPKLEEALQFLNGPDFIPLESQPARLEFDPARFGLHFRFPTPRPSQFVEQNVVYGRLYRCAEDWQKRPVIILLHGAGGADYHLEFPHMARQCNRAEFNAATLLAPWQFQRRPRQLAGLKWPDYLLMAQVDYAQAVAEIRALTGWLLAEGCPAVALWGNSYGGALAGLTACRDARLSAAVLAAPGLDMNVFLSAARQIIRPGLRAELLRQQPACEALNQTVLNLTNARPRIPKENILLIEAVHDLFVDRKSMEALWQAWGQPDIWRLSHSHASRILSLNLTGRVLRWLSPRLEVRRPKQL
jgi:pimeloyl-ACP methyl ester carboxylesterase